MLISLSFTVECLMMNKLSLLIYLFILKLTNETDSFLSRTIDISFILTDSEYIVRKISCNQHEYGITNLNEIQIRPL